MQTAKEASLLIEQDGPVVILTLNRPQARNAMDTVLVEKLSAALRQANDDPEIRVVVLTGAGKVFCSGADIKELARMARTDEKLLLEASNSRLALFALIRQLSKPVLASVNGMAMGGGCGLAMSCDLVIASDAAEFAYPEVKRGLVPGTVIVNLIRLVGQRQALDLVLSGRTIGAPEAMQFGLLNKVVPHAQLRGETLAYARTFAANDMNAMGVTKALFYEVCELDNERALERARDVNLATRPDGV